MTYCGKYSNKVIASLVLGTAALAGGKVQAGLGPGYTQPTTESVESVAGFVQLNQTSKVVLVPAQPDTGILVYGDEDLTLKPIGILGFPGFKDIDEWSPVEPTYNYQGPTYKLSYASFGLWKRVKPNQPYLWGVFAAGSAQDFSLPKTGSATYCGISDYWVPSTAKSASVLITTNWSGGKINAFEIVGIGPKVFAGTTIANNGASTFSYPTYGGKATALVEFYGPGAIQMSGTFSGSANGQQIAGGFVAWLVPGNPGTC